MVFALSRYQRKGCGMKPSVCRGDGTDVMPEQLANVSHTRARMLSVQRSSCGPPGALAF